MVPCAALTYRRATLGRWGKPLLESLADRACTPLFCGSTIQVWFEGAGNQPRTHEHGVQVEAALRTQAFIRISLGQSHSVNLMAEYPHSKAATEYRQSKQGSAFARVLHFTFGCAAVDWIILASMVAGAYLGSQAFPTIQKQPSVGACLGGLAGFFLGIAIAATVALAKRLRRIADSAQHDRGR